MRVFLFFVVVLPCAGFSALQWIWRYTFHRSTMDVNDRARVEHAFGLYDSRLIPIWDTAFPSWSFHLIKDVMSEWVKLDAQRGGKFLSLVALFWFVVSVALAIALGAVLLWRR